MFKCIECKNFMSLKNIKLNMTGKNNQPKKMIFLYGENGSGKSNVMSIFYVLKESIQTLMIINKIQDMIFDLENDQEEEKGLEIRNSLIEMVKSKVPTLEDIIRNFKTIGSKEDMELKYQFRLNGIDGEYEIKTNDKEIIYERLYYMVNKRRGTLFEITLDKVQINESTFINPKLRDDIKEDIRKFWGKHTLLAIIATHFSDKNTIYMNEGTNENLKEVLQFFIGTSVNVNKGNKGQSGNIGISHPIFANIENGEVDIEEEYELDALEELIRNILTNLYSDIKDVFYKKLYKDNKVKYNLYLKKMIGGKLIDIDFKVESTGTQRILDLIPLIFEGIKGRVSIIDEVDTGIHDLMMKAILEEIEIALEGQIISTTHNTLLMDILPREAVYFIKVDEDGNKEIRCLDDYERTQPTHSVRNRYLKGVYDGVPYVNSINFSDLINTYENILSEKVSRM